MSEMVSVTKAEFEDYLWAYPRTLQRDVIMFCEPALITWNDFTLGNGPEMIVASVMMNYDGPGVDETSYRVLK